MRTFHLLTHPLMNTIAILKDALEVYKLFPDGRNDVHIRNTTLLIYGLKMHEKIHPRQHYDTDHLFKNVHSSLIMSAIHVMEVANFSWTETYTVFKEHLYDPSKSYELT